MNGSYNGFISMFGSSIGTYDQLNVQSLTAGDITASGPIVGTRSIEILGNALFKGQTIFDGIVDMVEIVDMNGENIINLKDPVNPQDAATKAYVDSVGTYTADEVSIHLDTSKQFSVIRPAAGYMKSTGATGALDSVVTIPSTDITNTTFLTINNNLSDLNNASTARNNLGLQDMALQDSTNVTITGGSVKFLSNFSATDGQLSTCKMTTLESNSGTLNLGIVGDTVKFNSVSDGYCKLSSNALTSVNTIPNTDITGLGTLATLNSINLATNVGTSILPIANGGTNATTASGARTNLGLGSWSTFNTPAGSGVVSWNGSAFSTSTYVSSQWITSGSNIYYSTGNVGVGLTNPSTLFHVSGGISTLANGLKTVDGTVIANIQTTNASPISLSIGTIGSTTATSQGIWCDAAETGVSDNRQLCLQRYGGNVGIGTIPLTSLLQLGTRAAYSDGTNISIGFSNNSFNTALITARDFTDSGGFWTGALSFSTTFNAGTPSERMRIHGNGNVSIGSVTNAGRLLVSYGNTLAQDWNYGACSNVGSHDFWTGSLGKGFLLNSDGTYTVYSDGSNAYGWGWSLGSSRMDFLGTFISSATTNQSRSLSQMRLASLTTTGLGVNESSPSYRLHIRGNAGIQNGSKSTDDGLTVADIGSTDASNPLVLSIGLTASATAGNRGVWLDCIEAGLAARNLTLQRFGGNVGIGLSHPSSLLHVGVGDIRRGKLYINDSQLSCDISTASTAQATECSYLRIDSNTLTYRIYGSQTAGSPLNEANGLNLMIINTGAAYFPSTSCMWNAKEMIYNSSTLPNGMCTIYKVSTANQMRLVYNDGGTIRTFLLGSW